MKLTMLGTGNALVSECYNTCFVLSENDEYFLVDGGGGNGILHQLKHVGMDWKDMRTIFVTHKHLDHIMGAVWMIRMICQHMSQGRYEGEATIYAHDEVIGLLRGMAENLRKRSRRNFWTSGFIWLRWRMERRRQFWEGRQRFLTFTQRKQSSLVSAWIWERAEN